MRGARLPRRPSAGPGATAENLTLPGAGAGFLTVGDAAARRPAWG